MMWFCTPPGTSNEYGDTIPMRTAHPSQPQLLQHVPILGVPRYADRVRIGETLSDQLDPHVERAVGRIGQLDPPDLGHRPLRGEPDVHRVERRVRTQGEQRRSARHPGTPAEELHLDAVAGD